MNYIFLGPPGSGKGTQAQILAKKLNLFYFGTGDLMRQEAQNKTLLGLKFQKIWDKNPAALMPEDLTSELVESKIKNDPKNMGIVFDGYPRNLSQEKFLENLNKRRDFLVLNIEIPAAYLTHRMSTRRICENCNKVFFRANLSGLKKCNKCGGKLIQRADDTPEVLKQRIRVYNEETKPLIDYFKDKNILINIDGKPPIDVVEKEIWEKVNERNSS